MRNVRLGCAGGNSFSLGSEEIFLIGQGVDEIPLPLSAILITRDGVGSSPVLKLGSLLFLDLHRRGHRSHPKTRLSRCDSTP